jgi:GNAT superfamily N-acetyltransferase
MVDAHLVRALRLTDDIDRRQAARTIEVPHGFAVFNEEFAASYDNNKLVLFTAPDPAAALESCERVLAGAGVTHRLAIVQDDADGTACAPVFTAAGYRHDIQLLMAFKGEPPSPPAVLVEPIDLRTHYELDLASWRADLPDAGETALAQLAARRAAHARAADEVHFLGVRSDGAFRARAELYLDLANRVAQIEDVKTEESYRGRGYARAIIDSALRRAAAAGCDLTFLIADAGDWPKDFYARLGFNDIGRTHLFCRPS